MTSKDSYVSLCASDDTIPLFAQPWWLDATCGPTNWDVSIVMRNGQVVGALPYRVVKRYGFTQLTQPPLTQFLGPWMKVDSQKQSTLASREKEILRDLLDALPKFDFYNQAWSPQMTNWLPFYWNGFSQTTRYTLRLEDLSAPEALWNDLQENARREVRKAEKRFKLTIDRDPSLDEFIKLNDLVFKRQEIATPYDETLVRTIDNACLQRSSRSIFLARDPHGQPHAGVYLVWDANSAYYLLGGSDPNLRTSGAMSFCMWEAIKFASTVTKSFDFEGSMIEPIERFFRSFGATQSPYHYVYKARSPILRIVKAIQEAR